MLIRLRLNWYLKKADWPASAEVFREAEFECEDHGLRTHFNLCSTPPSTKHHRFGASLCLDFLVLLPPSGPQGSRVVLRHTTSRATSNAIQLLSHSPSLSLPPRQWPLSAPPRPDCSAPRGQLFASLLPLPSAGSPSSPMPPRRAPPPRVRPLSSRPSRSTAGTPTRRPRSRACRAIPST